MSGGSLTHDQLNPDSPTSYIYISSFPLYFYIFYLPPSQSVQPSLSPTIQAWAIIHIRLSINQRPNSNCNPPPTHTFPMTLCFQHTLQSHPIYANLTLQFLSPLNITTLPLPALTFLLHTSTKHPIIDLPLGLLPTHHTKPSHLHTRGQAISTLPLPPHPHFQLYHYCMQNTLQS